MSEDNTKTISPGGRIYSNKISERRRALFPHCESTNMEADANPLNLNPESFEYQNISKIPSTELIRRILESPERGMVSTDIDTSPCRKTGHKNSISSLPLTEILKTPNDSTTHTGEAPKLSRKSVGGTSDNEDPSSSCNKSSKVRTTLFRDIEIAFSTKQFYPSTSPNTIKKKVPISIPQLKKLDIPRSRKSRPKKKFFGQINAGVRHRIRKKTDKSPKVSKASVSHIKTYKSDLAVKSKFDDYLKDLEEINENKKVKLIQHVPEKVQSGSSMNIENTCLKRLNEDTEEISSKKFKSSESDLEILTSESFFENEILEDEISVPIENILNTLNESVGEDKENKSRDKEGILSPTSELSTMTLGLKLSSPRKARNLTAIFQKMDNGNSQVSSENSQSQFYPLFYPQKRKSEKVLEKEKIVKKKRMKLTPNQMLLDAGQKKFGLVECAECNYVYSAGDPEDENLHDKHHNATNILQFHGWKNERIIVATEEGRIIQILPSDSKQWIDKVKRISEYINREMGYFNMDIDTSRSMILLYIFNKAIIGCLIAEGRASANKILTANIDVDLCSLEEYPVVCGISRLWIAPLYRQKGVATKLMEALRKCFLPNRTIDKNEIALSAPTPDGKLFATKYFGTPNFYTYLN